MRYESTRHGLIDYRWERNDAANAPDAWPAEQDTDAPGWADIPYDTTLIDAVHTAYPRQER